MPLAAADAPRSLSVVIAAWTDEASLARCLAAVRSQLRPEADEVIVARNFVTETMPVGVRDLVLDPSTTVPRLRAAGLAVATGRIVAFLEDHAVPGPGWRDAIVRAFVPPVRVVGGPVDLAPVGRAIDWAVYFYDHARFAPPMRSGMVPSLSGANIAFERSLLSELTTLLTDGVHEATLERELRRRGVVQWLSNDAGVTVSRSETPGKAIRLAFALARGYAARRVAGAGPGLRLARAATAPLVPMVLFVRVAWAVSRSSHLMGRFVRAAGWLILLQLAWGAGEGAGSLAGAGRSDTQWR